ncbi:MAG: hypothetical protein V2I27_13465 [Erythrobacter sp.]|jgi:hypothetical protein|nr:hypothetical protein [Erythrobacter sp.]
MSRPATPFSSTPFSSSAFASTLASQLAGWPVRDNTALDSLFYDVDALTRDERRQLAAREKPEGIILEVGPSYAPSLRIWPGIEACDCLRDDYAALTVAGVGSSAVGAAALARNVADALDAPVLGVVSGLGLADLGSEALGGFFLFGGLNAIRHAGTPFEAWHWLAPPMLRPRDPGHTFRMARESADVRAIRELLGDGGVKVPYLVGHSKGNLVLSEALYALREADRQGFRKAAADMRVVTFSARIAMPRELTCVTDVMGELDTFGALNSRPDIPVDVSVPAAWHHTNTRLPFHLPVTKVLGQIARRPGG